MPPLPLWLRLARPFSFPASVAGVLVGTAAAVPISRWKWGILAANVALVLLFHAFGNLLNDYRDFRSGVDRRQEGDEGRPGRFLVRGEILPRQVLSFAVACLLLALPLAALMVARGGWPAGAIGLVGVLGAYSYTGWPLQLKYRGWGELCIFMVFGPAIVAGAVWMQVGRLDLGALFLSVPVGMVVTGILAAGNLRDLEEDKEAGIHTLARRIGRRAYLLLYFLLLFGAPAFLVALVAARVAPAWSLLGALAVPLAVPPAADAARGHRAPDADAITARYMTAFAALTCVGLILGGGVG
jgi:1,4-dihydroxy-2-naphthoate octaprenyltransferase